VTVEIRRARDDEAAALTDLNLRSKAHWGYDESFMAAAKAELWVTDGTIRRTWVATTEGRAVGVITMSEPDDRMEVELLFVEPMAIGTGVGRALWTLAVEQSLAAGVKTLIVQSDPNAVGFYERMGAEQIGESISPSTGRSLPLLEVRIDG
jgi:N-acetylglutamate synthase-like GNAT family acetyltransferase